MTYEKVLLADVWPQLEPLFALHFQEIAHYKDIPLSPDKETYLKLEVAGMFVAYIARDEVNGSIVGYQGFFIKNNIHYKESLYGQQDVLFIHPACRGRGHEFIKWCDDQLAYLGVQVVVQHMKAAHSFGPSLEKMGYELQDLIYTKRLDLKAEGV